MAITKEQIWAAADELDTAGQNPTLSAVRKAVGGGSYTTISEGMAEWKARRAERNTPLREPPPANLSEEFTELLFEVWGAALELANGRLAAERSALEGARVQLLEERLEATQLADQVVAELEMVKATAENEGARARTATAEVESLRVQVVAYSERAATAEARADELTKRAGDLNTELVRLNTRADELVEANGRLAHERGALEGIRSKLEAENVALDSRARREREESAARAAKAEEQASDLRNQLGAAMERAAAAEAQGRELRERLEAFETAAESRLREARERIATSEAAAVKGHQEVEAIRADLDKERTAAARAGVKAEQLEKRLEVLQRDADQMREQNQQLIVALSAASSAQSGTPEPRKK